MKNRITQINRHCKKRSSVAIGITLLLITFSIQTQAQSSVLDSLNRADTLHLKPVKVHSPTKATLFSTALPGLGQVYNKKYWKVPIIYGGIATMLYFAITNNNSLKNFKTAYGLRIDGDPNTVDEYVDVLSDQSLKLNMDYSQRNRDLTSILAGLIYVFNIVDAAVDAHLYYFPKNDKLSFNLQPSLELTTNNQISSGFKLVINL